MGETSHVGCSCVWRCWCCRSWYTYFHGIISCLWLPLWKYLWTFSCLLVLILFKLYYLNMIFGWWKHVNDEYLMHLLHRKVLLSFLIYRGAWSLPFVWLKQTSRVPLFQFFLFSGSFRLLSEQLCLAWNW